MVGTKLGKTLHNNFNKTKGSQNSLKQKRSFKYLALLVLSAKCLGLNSRKDSCCEILHFTHFENIAGYSSLLADGMELHQKLPGWSKQAPALSSSEHSNPPHH